MGREEHCKQILLACWGVLAVYQPHWVCPHSWCVCFPGLHISGSRLLCRKLSEVSPGLHALPRSKPMRFRFSGTPQRCRLSWACVLCPSQVRAAQVTRCLVSTVSPSWRVHLITLPIPANQFSGCTTDADPQVCRVSLLGSCPVLRPSQWMSTVQNPKKSWLVMKPDCSLVEDAYLKPGLTLPALDALACLSPVGDGPVCSQAWKCIQFSSVQFSRLVVSDSL